MGLTNETNQQAPTSTSHQPGFFQAPQEPVQGLPVEYSAGTYAPQAVHAPYPAVRAPKITVKDNQGYVNKLENALLGKLNSYIHLRARGFYSSPPDFKIGNVGYNYPKDTLTFRRVFAIVECRNKIEKFFKAARDNASHITVPNLLNEVENCLHEAVRAENLHSATFKKDQYISKVDSKGATFFKGGTCISEFALAQCFELTALARKELHLSEQREVDHAVPERSSSCVIL